jgi:hypothetical protein
MDVMIERYINEVKKRVNADQRDDVERDLLKAIEGREGQELIDTLSILGHPRDVAATYSKRQPYVISPAYYPVYRHARKIVIYAVAMIVTIYATIDAITGMTATTLIEALTDVFGSVLAAVFIGVIFAYGLVTLAFSWFESKKIRMHRAFNPRKMTELTCFQDACIDPKKTLIDMAFWGSIYVFLVLAFTLYRGSIGWYDQGEMVASFYVDEAITLFLPLVTFGLFLSFSIDFVLLFKRALATWSAVLMTIKYGYALILFTLLLKLPNAINPRFIAYYAQQQKDVSYDDLFIRISHTTTIVLVAIILVIGVRLALLWLKLRRLQ